MFQTVHGCPGQFVRKVAIHTRYQNDRITQGVSYFSDAETATDYNSNSKLFIYGKVTIFFISVSGFPFAIVYIFISLE